MFHYIFVAEISQNVSLCCQLWVLDGDENIFPHLNLKQLLSH